MSMLDKKNLILATLKESDMWTAAQNSDHKLPHHDLCQRVQYSQDCWDLDQDYLNSGSGFLGFRF